MPVMRTSEGGLESLPSEVLLHILSFLEARQLLPLTLVSQRFCALIISILRLRIALASPPVGYDLILDCYRPAAKYTEPPLNCEYIGTDGLSDILLEGSGGGSVDGGNEHPNEGVRLSERLSRLNGLYSRFRPSRRTERRTRRHPAGDVPGSRTYDPAQTQAQSSQAETYPRPQVPDAGLPNAEASDGQAAAGPASSVQSDNITHRGSQGGQGRVTREEEKEEQKVIIPINLDGSELFTQLCANTMMVVQGPKTGLYRSSVPVHDCIIRIWRHWLAEEASILASGEFTPDEGIELDKQHGILWSNKSKQVCMRFLVRSRTWRNESSAASCNPNHPEVQTARRFGVAMADDDLPVTYELEFQEFFVRTSHILFKMEEARGRLHDDTGKAMVFGQF